MRLVEEEDQLWLVKVADFGQLFEQLGKQPQQKRPIKARVLHELVGGEKIDGTAPVAIRTHEILDRERRLAKELAGALGLQHQQLSLHRTDAGAGHVTVPGPDLLGIFSDVGQELAQVLEIDAAVGFDYRQFGIVVGITKRDIDHALLDIVQVEHARQQQRSQFEHRGPDRVPLLPEQVPQHNGKFVRFVVKAEIFGAFHQGLFALAGRRDAGQIALDVRREYRDAGARKPFGKHL